MKVLLHELLHAFEYHCVKNFTLNSNDLSCLGKTLESEQNWDEAIVETWATILTNENAYKKRNMNIEKKFSIFQTAKILKHHGFNTWNEFWKPEKITSIIQSKPAIFPPLKRTCEPVIFPVWSTLKALELIKRFCVESFISTPVVVKL